VVVPELVLGAVIPDVPVEGPRLEPAGLFSGGNAALGLAEYFSPTPLNRLRMLPWLAFQRVRVLGWIVPVVNQMRT